MSGYRLLNGSPVPAPEDDLEMLALAVDQATHRLTGARRRATAAVSEFFAHCDELEADLAQLRDLLERYTAPPPPMVRT